PSAPRSTMSLAYAAFSVSSANSQYLPEPGRLGAAVYGVPPAASKTAEYSLLTRASGSSLLVTRSFPLVAISSKTQGTGGNSGCAAASPHRKTTLAVAV